MEVTAELLRAIIEDRIRDYENATDSILNDVENSTIRADINSRKHLITSVMRQAKEIINEITDKTFLPSIAQSIKDREDYEHLVTQEKRQRGPVYDETFI